ncbi:ribonuclease H-like domain-containing protein [Eubacteriales bacterium mix99]
MIANLKSKLRAMKSGSHPGKPETARDTGTTVRSAGMESMSNLGRSGNPGRECSPSPGICPDRGSLGGTVVSGPDGEFVRKRTIYGYEENYGRIPLFDLRNAVFTDSFWWTRLDRDLCPKDIVFLDTETTGLAGGTGTVAFLVGLGYVEEDGLVVDQYLMRDFDEEVPMLQAVADQLRHHSVLVTFNGKSFDWPLLEGRLILSGIPPIHCEDAHLDLLPVARRLWAARLPDCSLSTLEEKILFHHRTEDIPGSMIPNIYLDFLKSRTPGKMRQVLQHNEWDIAAMAALLVHFATLYHDPEINRDACELLGIGKELERAHRIRQAAVCYQKCIDLAPHSFVLNAKKRLAYLTKRYRGPQEAMELWADLAGKEGSSLCFPLIEMAKFLEHREKDFPGALECTEKAILLVNRFSDSDIGPKRLQTELLHRRQRLMKKMRRRMEQWG